MFETIGLPMYYWFRDSIWGPGLDVMPHWGPFIHVICLLLLLLLGYFALFVCWASLIIVAAFVVMAVVGWGLLQSEANPKRERRPWQRVRP